MRNWTFKPDINRLESDDEVAQLTGKASAVLKLLASRGGEVISQDDIRHAVWQDVHVTPDLVREYIFDLRQALGDKARQPHYIETVRGKGYRLLGGVDLARSTLPEPGPMRLPRIAVLRPDVLDGDLRWQRFADGMADELITDLARFSDLAVIARISSFGADKSRRMDKIAEDLGCEYVLESSLSVFDDRLRAQFQLIDGRSGLHVWAETYDREITSLPEVSSGVALSVGNELGGIAGAVNRAERRYATRRPASELSAYENYVAACRLEEHFDRESMRSGLAHIERAIELDPEFARSHLIRGFFCDKGLSISDERSPSEWLSQTATSAARALEIDSRDPLILSFSARTLASTGNLPAARSVAIRAADFARNESIAALSTASALTLISGNYALAEELLDVAFELAPNPPSFYSFAKGRNLLFSGHAREAELSVEDAPEFESTYVIRCLAQSLQGKRDDALRTHEELVKKCPYFKFEDYPESLGIVSEATLATYEEAVAKLSL
ncbi:MAG: winged helix-turn-helix domain-containing protein [Pseudomonadota bacterium]